LFWNTFEHIATLFLVLGCMAEVPKRTGSAFVWRAVEIEVPEKTYILK
jgi:hypothetical protein